jgi:Uma2 family endonuclease
VKRQFYLDIGIPDYWIIDATHRTIRVVRQHRDDEDIADVLVWAPPGTSEALRLRLSELF